MFFKFNKFSSQKLSQPTDIYPRNTSQERLERIILDTSDYNYVIDKVVEEILNDLKSKNSDCKIVIVCLLDRQLNLLKKAAISQIVEVEKKLQKNNIPFKELNISLDQKNNLCIKTLNEKKLSFSNNWNDILGPDYTEEITNKIQDIMDTKSIALNPITLYGKAEGVVIFGLGKAESEITQSEKDWFKSLSDIIALASQNFNLNTNLESITKKLTNTNDELIRANSQLQELDKLKDEFVSLASHELRTPMIAIQGSLSTILDGYAGGISDQTREFLTAAYNENNRLIRLVNNLLNISRIEAGRLKFEISNFSLEEPIYEIINNLNSAAKEKNLYLKYEKDGELPQVNADRDMIKEVLINIIGNAIKFTHRGGISIRINKDDQNDKLVVSITDTGSGIAGEDQLLLFKKFSQISGNYARTAGGTGLGLYISKKIIEGIGGRIWLESKIGVGSTFFFSLPIVK